eukprot:scaffold9266_cov112-Skeletonema_marinoi.AAC.4
MSYQYPVPFAKRSVDRVCNYSVIKFKYLSLVCNSCVEHFNARQTAYFSGQERKRKRVSILLRFHVKAGGCNVQFNEALRSSLRCCSAGYHPAHYIISPKVQTISNTYFISDLISVHSLQRQPD